MGPGQIIKNQINLDLIKIIPFCLKIYDFLRHPTYGWVYGWVNRWVSGWGSGQITKNRINLEVIEIIQFFLKICDLLRHPHLRVGVWVVG